VLVPRDEVGRVVDHGPIGGLSSAARMLPGRTHNRWEQLLPAKFCEDA
jgi:hypothetical protein